MEKVPTELGVLVLRRPSTMEWRFRRWKSRAKAAIDPSSLPQGGCASAIVGLCVARSGVCCSVFAGAHRGLCGDPKRCMQARIIRKQRAFT